MQVLAEHNATTVAELEETTKLPFQSISRHLKTLKKYGLAYKPKGKHKVSQLYRGKPDGPKPKIWCLMEADATDINEAEKRWWKIEHPERRLPNTKTVDVSAYVQMTMQRLGGWDNRRLTDLNNAMRELNVPEIHRSQVTEEIITKVTT